MEIKCDKCKTFHKIENYEDLEEIGRGHLNENLDYGCVIKKVKCNTCNHIFNLYYIFEVVCVKTENEF